ncbi:hypothetical protein Pmani_021838 [Petrolisthes manimaculis]|uniref:Uncharacterized protein n=1 Tax=Petrolisthes manimaculis TaxID=1843537 RepID=A0AAE1PD89_9EUCA|nr:hypothetical protein Pmani_021838 [Petrolisthes manimaculis]
MGFIFALLINLAWPPPPCLAQANTDAIINQQSIRRQELRGGPDLWLHEINDNDSLGAGCIRADNPSSHILPPPPLPPPPVTPFTPQPTTQVTIHPDPPPCPTHPFSLRSLHPVLYTVPDLLPRSLQSFATHPFSTSSRPPPHPLNPATLV